MENLDSTNVTCWIQFWSSGRVRVNGKIKWHWKITSYNIYNTIEPTGKYISKLSTYFKMIAIVCRKCSILCVESAQ